MRGCMQIFLGLCKYFSRSILKLHTSGLSDHLNKKLYGQHLAKEGVMYFIARHLQSAEPDKALVLSFHGRTGTGKHYVSSIIAQHLYRKGLHSQFVHLISAAREFPHEERVPYYKVYRGHFFQVQRYSPPFYQQLFMFVTIIY